MRLKLLWIIFAFATAVQGASFDVQTPFLRNVEPVQQQSQAAHLAAEVLARFHYKSIPFDAALSAKIFDKYLKSIDSEKVFFLQSDIDQIASARDKLGDAILAENLTAPFAIFNLYVRRAADRFAYARSLLSKGFDFQQNESYQYGREKEPWPKFETEMRDLWHKRVKNDWLRLKLAGKDDKSIYLTLDKRYENSLKRIGQLTSQDAFEAFMNAFTTSIEPHTNYLGAQAAEEFDISMRLSLVGIGAVLAEKDDFATIRELVPGGPAALSGQLNPGDRIISIAQGEGGIMTDVMGWRLQETVALIRGAENSRVILEVLPADASPDGKHRLVTLVRKKIRLEEQAAKKSVLTVKDGNATRHVGVISLPSFYEDFNARQQGHQDFKSATRDVTRLLEELKKEKVDSVLIDLRNNGGGSLTEAVELTGLFIDKGPVLQQRDANGAITVESDTDAGVAWDGPLGVLINRGSASASEIFAAAIQDYGRGLIIGHPSFGKGTVQTVISLDQIAESEKPQFGNLKLTVAQFFRINGGTTQLRGVTPDILFPAGFDAEDFGESSFDNALPWAQIKAADYSIVGDLKVLLPTLLTRHGVRIKNDRDFQFLHEDIEELKVLRDKNLISLNEAERIRERNAREVRISARENQRTGSQSANDKVFATESTLRSVSPTRDDGLQADERNFANDLAVENARKNAKDILLNEAVHILSDEVTARIKPATLSTPH